MKSMVKLAKQDYIWNTIAGLINAAEAVVMSMIVTRITGLADAGMLTIAFAIGNLVMPIGKFGIRNYQVTDIENKFSFQIYLKTRLLTVLLMIISVFAYLFYAVDQLDYERNKLGIIFAICMIYAVESIEDVIWGYYQRQGRMDMGAKLFCFRWLGILVIFPIALWITEDLQFTLMLCLVISLFLFLILLRVSYSQICSESDRNIKLLIRKRDLGEIGELLKIAIPLFGISFLSFYVNNASKYAIDAYLTDEVQACYGFVAMPVFVIGLLNNFIYQPTLVPMASEWEQKQNEKFCRRIWKQIVALMIISSVCLLGAYMIGIPVLSWLYHTDLSAYKTELMILLLAGGFFAISWYLSVVLTIMRCQKALLWPYGCVAIVAAAGMKEVVLRRGTVGAAFGYLVLMIFLTVLYGGMLTIRLRGNGK